MSVLRSAVRPRTGPWRVTAHPRINWQHPLSQGLVVAVAGGHPVELVTGRSLTPNAGAQAAGGGFECNATGHGWQAPLNASQRPGFWSAFVYATALSSAIAEVFSVHFDNAGNSPYLPVCFFKNANYATGVGTAGGFGIFDFSGAFPVVAGATVKLGATWDGTNVRCYGNGHFDSSGGPGVTGAASYASTAQLVIGESSDSGYASRNANHRVYVGLVWGRLLSDAEMAAIAADPYCWLA